MELVSMDLQHEREIIDLQKRIRRLETKIQYQTRCSLISPSESKSPCSISTGGGGGSDGSCLMKSTPSNLPIHQKDSAFVSQKPSHQLVDESADNCQICESDPNELYITKPIDPSSSYHLKFSKINMAMKKLKDDIKCAERKKKTSL
jgi:hypothetical protein